MYSWISARQYESSTVSWRLISMSLVAYLTQRDSLFQKQTCVKYTRDIYWKKTFLNKQNKVYFYIYTIELFSRKPSFFWAVTCLLKKSSKYSRCYTFKTMKQPNWNGGHRLAVLIEVAVTEWATIFQTGAVWTQVRRKIPIILAHLQHALWTTVSS